MKVFTFSNGKVVLQKNTNRDFKTQCILWGCFDLKTGNPLEYFEREATEKELKLEVLRMEEVENEYLEVFEANEKINTGNEKLANASNINEFMNAYN